MLSSSGGLRKKKTLLSARYGGDRGRKKKEIPLRPVQVMTVKCRWGFVKMRVRQKKKEGERILQEHHTE